jgi:hypothetical protein
MSMRTACGVAVLLLVSSPSARASDTQAERQSLKGLESISVLIESVEPELERDGIVASQLKTDVESRLRESGIRVSNLPEAVFVYVAVKALKRSAGSGYVYTVTLEVEQPVTVDRTGQSLRGSTWSAPSTVGIVPLDRASPVVREVVRDQVDKFINAFLAVNPKP